MHDTQLGFWKNTFIPLFWWSRNISQRDGSSLVIGRVHSFKFSGDQETYHKDWAFGRSGINSQEINNTK